MLSDTVYNFYSCWSVPTEDLPVRDEVFVINVMWCRCTQIKTYSWDNAQVILVGNKSDLEQERVVSTERGRRLANQLGNSDVMKFWKFEVSEFLPTLEGT